MLYLLIAFIVAILGASAGIGGGVIIKPVLDAITPYPADNISILSSFTVLTISLTSVIRNLIRKTKFAGTVAVLLGVGAIVGGILGDLLFMQAVAGMADDLVKILQAAILLILMLLVFFYMNRWKGRISFRIENKALILLAGLGLGMLSAFLGVGGGPINVAVLCLFFSMEMKDAAINSLLIIVLSQTAKLLRHFLSIGVTGFLAYDLHPLLFMIPAAVAGSLLGVWLNRRIQERYLVWMYNLALWAIMGINLWNILVRTLDR